jgi:predicted nucleic acid-binding protein
VLVYAEVHEYLLSRGDYHQRHQPLRQLLVEIPPFTLSYRILRLYGQIRRALRPPQGPGVIGDVDTLLAATALQHDLTFVKTD